MIDVTHEFGSTVGRLPKESRIAAEEEHIAVNIGQGTGAEQGDIEKLQEK